MSQFNPANIPIIGLDSVDVGVFSADALGALPGAYGAQNYTAIQKALTAANTAGGGIVTLLTPGVYAINASLTIYDRTFFKLAPGVTLFLTASTNAPILRTAASLVTATSVTLTWSSGSAVTVGWTEHGLTTDDYICIQGASTTRPQYNQMVKVVSVTDANNVVVHLPIVPTATATGSPTAIKCTRGFRIEGGTWNGNFTNNQGGSGYNRSTMLIAFAANFVVRDVIGLDNYRLVTQGGVMDYAYMNMHATCYTGGSEMFKTYGPARNGYAVNISGQTSDDFSSIQPQEDAAFPTNKFSAGNIIGITHENFNGIVTGGQAVIPVYGDDTYQATDIVLRNIQGISTSNQNIVSLNKGQSGSVGLLGSVLIDGVHGTTAGAVVNLTGGTTVDRAIIRNVDARGSAGVVTVSSFSARNLVIEDIEHNPVGATDKAVDINLSTGVINKLRIARVHSKQTAMTAATPMVSIVTTTTAIQDIELDSTLNESTNMRTLNLAVGTVRMLSVHDCVQTSAANGDAFINIAGATALTLAVRNCDIAAITTFGVNSTTAATALNLEVRDCNIQSNTNGFMRLTQATNALAVTYKGGGNTIGSAANTLTVVSGAPTVAIQDNDLVIDVGLTGIQTAIGQYARHSSAVAGRNGATQQGLAICNGTNWVAVGTGASQVNVLIV